MERRTGLMDKWFYGKAQKKEGKEKGKGSEKKKMNAKRRMTYHSVWLIVGI